MSNLMSEKPQELKPEIRRRNSRLTADGRQRGVACRFSRQARYPIFLSQSPYTRLNHGSVRVSRRKASIRQIGNRNPGLQRRSVEALAKFKAKFKLNFTLLSDPDFNGSKPMARAA